MPGLEIQGYANFIFTHFFTLWLIIALSTFLMFQHLFCLNWKMRMKTTANFLLFIKENVIFTLVFDFFFC